MQRNLQHHTRKMQQKTKKQVNRDKALQLHRGGFTTPKIAEALGVSRQTVWRWIRDDLAERVTERLEIEDQRAIQAERYTYLWNTLQSQVDTGDIKAIRAATAVLQSLDDLLGTPMPKTAIVNSTVNSTVAVSPPAPAPEPPMLMTDEQFLTLYKGLGYGTK